MANTVTIPQPVPIFRLIHISNLSIYLRRGGMHAPNYVPSDGLVYRTIHNIDIQRERKIRCVTCKPDGSIHDYVCFYFGMRSPMLYQLCNSLVDGYDEGQEPLIYLVSTVEAVDQAAIPYVFSDGHGIAAFTQWFNRFEDLKEVDWVMVYAKFWFDRLEDPDRQRRKQAEFLVYKYCPLTLIHEIGVINENARNEVNSILVAHGWSFPVNIHRDWYY